MPSPSRADIAQHYQQNRQDARGKHPGVKPCAPQQSWLPAGRGTPRRVFVARDVPFPMWSGRDSLGLSVTVMSLKRRQSTSAVPTLGGTVDGGLMARVFGAQ